MKRLRLIIVGLGVLVVLALALYVINNSSQQESIHATDVAGLTAVSAQLSQRDAELQRLRKQQEDAALTPTLPQQVATVIVPGPTKEVRMPSTDYSYQATVNTDPVNSAPNTYLRVSVVVPPGLNANDLSYRLEGGQDQPISTVANNVPIEPGKYTVYIVKKADGGNGTPLGSTGLIEINYGETKVVVFTYIPQAPPAP